MIFKVFRVKLYVNLLNMTSDPYMSVELTFEICRMCNPFSYFKLIEFYIIIDKMESMGFIKYRQRRFARGRLSRRRSQERRSRAGNEFWDMAPGWFGTHSDRR